MNKDYTGALVDTRSEELKNKDFQLEGSELAGSPSLNWQEKKIEDWKNYPARDQVGSSSCVAQAFSKALFTLGYDITSAHPIYRQRKNFNEKGMWLYDAADILKKTGTVPETVSQSQNLNETQMNRDIDLIAKEYLAKTPIKIGGYAYVNKASIDEIAKAVEEHKHCVLTFGASNQEWTDMPEVKGEPVWYHAICAVDYVLYGNKKYIVIEDSWGENVGRFGDRRLISEEFIKQRCAGAMVILPYVKEQKTKYTFSKILRIGSKGVEVEELQKALKELGFFPDIQTTKTFGKITETAVKKFQEAYKQDILIPAGLNKATGIFGQLTIKKLNKIMNDKWYTSSSGSGNISLTVKGGAVAIVPIALFIASTFNISITESEITEIINAGTAILSGAMIILGIARKVYNNLNK